MTALIQNLPRRFEIRRQSYVRIEKYGKYRVTGWPFTPGSKVETLTTKRLVSEYAETDYLPIEMTLQQTAQANYACLVINESDFELKIEAIKITRNGAELCQTKAQDTDNWTIAAQSGKQISWAPLPDPGNTLRRIEGVPNQNNVVSLEIISCAGLNINSELFRSRNW